MASSERLHARRPVVLVVAMLVVFAGLDTAIFRSGLYAGITSTKSVAGQFAAVARYRISVPPPPGKRQVLVLGHSKIEAALSERQFDEENPDSHLKIVMGSSGGTTLKMWYYLLKCVDPHQDRYAAVVLPIDTYLTPPQEFDDENQISIAQFLAPMLDVEGWRDLIGTYTKPDVRARAIVGALVSSHLYALDLQDLLLHPVDRYRAREWERAAVPTFLYEWKGYEGDVTDLEIDPKTAKIIHAPEHLDAFRRAEAEVRFHIPPPEVAQAATAQFHAFRRQWLKRIVGLYANTETKVIVVQTPRWPFFMPAITPIPGAPNVRDEIPPSKNVIVVPEPEFEDLEEPKNFYDVLHVNTLGRHAFTARFAKLLRTELGDLPNGP